jgi:hypothetical protein
MQNRQIEKRSQETINKNNNQKFAYIRTTIRSLRNKAIGTSIMKRRPATIK